MSGDQRLAGSIVKLPKGRSAKLDHSAILRMAELGLSDVEIATWQGGHPAYVKLVRVGRVRLRVKGEKPAQTRIASVHLAKHVAAPPLNSPALVDGRTMYPKTVKAPENGILKSGYTSSKIGKTITKGKWKTYPIYTLALEERATCPRSCPMWGPCYGNHLYLAKRYQHGEALERQLVLEVFALAKRYPNGFAIRLHTLGDFFSVGYVNLWRLLLDMVPPLHVFGFTARIDADDPIAVELERLVAEKWDRFAIRFSNAPQATRSTVVIDHPDDKPADAIQCPQQVAHLHPNNKPSCCADCAICWGSERRVAFLKH